MINSIDQIEQTLGKEALKSEKPSEISKNKAFEIIYTMPSEAVGFVQIKQKYCVIENEAYLITYTSSENEYENYLLRAEEIFNSFSF